MSSTKKRIRRASEQSRQSKPELKPSDFGVDNIRSNKSFISSDSDSSFAPKKLCEDFHQKSSQSGDVQHKIDQANLIASISDVSSETSTEERILATKISTSKKSPKMERLRVDSKVYEKSLMINSSVSKTDINDTSELDTKSTTSSSESDSSSDSSEHPKSSLQIEQMQQSQKIDSDTTVDSYKELENAIKVRNFHCMFRNKIF